MINKDNHEIPIICIVAMNQNRVIGDGKKLIWHLPDDLKRLKTMTLGAPLIMGRKTWNSIGRPLPGRANIVLTKSKSWAADGAIVVNSFDKALLKANEWIINRINSNIDVNRKIFLFGGGQIYKLGLEYCDLIEMTKVIFDIDEGSKFPKLNEDDWRQTQLEHFKKDKEFPEYSYWRYQRKKH